MSDPLLRALEPGAKTPTDEQLGEFERLYHNALNTRELAQRAKAEHEQAVARLTAYRANVFEGEQVAA